MLYVLLLLRIKFTDRGELIISVIVFCQKKYTILPAGNRLNLMNVNRINKETVVSSLAKLVANKRLVRSYLKGEISAQTLTKNGIQLAKPL